MLTPTVPVQRYGTCPCERHIFLWRHSHTNASFWITAQTQKTQKPNHPCCRCPVSGINGLSHLFIFWLPNYWWVLLRTRERERDLDFSKPFYFLSSSKNVLPKNKEKNKGKTKHQPTIHVRSPPKISVLSVTEQNTSLRHQVFSRRLFVRL